MVNRPWYKSGMADARISITIRRPLEDVFAVLTDVEKTSTWSAPAVGEHWTTPPPHGIGARRHAVTSMMGIRSQNDAEVTGYDLNHSWTMKSVSGPPFVVSATFQPVEGGTRVDWTWSFTFRGPLKLFDPMVTSLFARQFAKDLTRLKKLMESGAL
jgi:Polyketide cyclase / dehydrase and lipid transport